MLFRSAIVAVIGLELAAVSALLDNMEGLLPSASGNQDDENIVNNEFHWFSMVELNPRIIK